jgi:MFS superfamily sulfate permease-like transporter
MWRVSRIDFYAAAIALLGVLLLGILEGILLAALASMLMLLFGATRPHVAFLGRVPGTKQFSDLSRHPDNEALPPSVIAFRPEMSVLYVNAEAVLDAVMSRLREPDTAAVRVAVCDLSSSPYLDLAGVRMLHDLHGELAQRDIALRVVGARGRVRDLLRADGLDKKLGGIERTATLSGLLGDG